VFFFFSTLFLEVLATMKSTIVALVASTAAAKDLALTWKDCGGAGTKTKITSFSPSTITLGQKTTLTGKGDLSEQVTGANFDLMMTGATGQLLHCSGDASVTKSCNLPLGTGSLTFEGMSFPIAPGSVPVNVDIKLSSLLPGPLTKTKTITKATAKNGDDLFCMEIDSASATEENDDDLINKLPPLVGKLVCELAEKGEQPAINAICSKVHFPDCQGLLQKVFDKLLQKCQPSGSDFVEGGNLNLAWSDCGDSSFHAKVNALAPTTLPIGKTTTVTGSGNTDEQVTAGGFQITAKFGPVTEHYSGDVCAKKVFHLPAFLGSITWNGLTCPVAKGSVSVGVDVQLASIIPAKLAKGDILIKASDASSNGNLICLDIKTSGAQTVVV
jgi:hypothetical protein